jgi:hypothetical protein
MVPFKGNGAVEAVIDLRLVPTSISDIYNMMELLVCCLTGIWEHTCTLTQAKLALDFGFWGHLWRAAATATAMAMAR